MFPKLISLEKMTVDTCSSSKNDQLADPNDSSSGALDFVRFYGIYTLAWKVVLEIKTSKGL